MSFSFSEGAASVGREERGVEGGKEGEGRRERGEGEGGGRERG